MEIASIAWQAERNIGNTSDALMLDGFGHLPILKDGYAPASLDGWHIPSSAPELSTKYDQC